MWYSFGDFSCFYGCGGSSSSDDSTGTGETVRLSGTVNTSGYTVTKAPTFLEKVFAFFTGNDAIAAGEQVDEVWALPTPDGQIDAENFSYKQVADINSDGTFSLDLLQQITYQGVTYDLDWVLLLINSQEALKENRIVGYVAMSDVSESMMRMPISTMMKQPVRFMNLLLTSPGAMLRPA